MEKKNFFSTIEENVISVGIVIMFIMETINVICKFAFPDFAGIPAEIAIFAYIWVCFLCMGFCTKKSANIIVDALTMHYPDKLKGFLNGFQYILDAVLTVVFIYGSVVFVAATKAEGSVGVTGMPLWIIYLAPLVGFIINLIRDIQMFMQAVKGQKND